MGWINNNGRRMVKLTITLESKRKDILLAPLIALAFIGPKPVGKEVNHKDYDKANDRAGNLEYVTRSENLLHSYRHGRWRPVGELHGRCKLTDGDIAKMRNRAAVGESGAAIARDFGVSVSHANRVIRGEQRQLQGSGGEHS